MTDREHRNALERRLEPLFDPVCDPRVDWSAHRWVDAPHVSIQLVTDRRVVSWFLIDDSLPLGPGLVAARRAFVRAQARLAERAWEYETLFPRVGDSWRP